MYGRDQDSWQPGARRTSAVAQVTTRLLTARARVAAVDVLDEVVLAVLATLTYATADFVTAWRRVSTTTHLQWRHYAEDNSITVRKWSVTTCKIFISFRMK